MGTAKVVSLTVRPLQASHLCFEVDGILGESYAQLGAPVTGFDFPALYNALSKSPTISGDPSRLRFDATAIHDGVKSYTLLTLRAEAGKATLNKAVGSRQNSYFAKYGNATDIIAKMNTFYSPAVFNSKPNRLAILSSLADDQATALRSAYISDGRTGVVKTTGSILNSSTQSGGQSSESGQSNLESVGTVVSGTIPLPPGSGAPFAGWTFPGPDTLQLEQGTSSDSTTSTARSSEHQMIVNTDYGYRTPYFESQAQNERAQISLIDQQFAQFMSGQNLPNLVEVFKNELSAIDSDVYRLQIAYLNTILLSPFDGTVTGIYKTPGDAVRAGEPVVRVENNGVVLLVATLIYRGPITIGASVTVTTQLFDSSGAPTSIMGTVAAARGHTADDHWEVIVQCNNLDSTAKPIFPLGYHFDYDDTTVSIT
ncbi:MAG TPA: HlyD family efflux transporter periplasmic adaptor subunit [Steroidobacteraceae bacterium]|jgi:biotin carboxyl carrier protein